MRRFVNRAVDPHRQVTESLTQRRGIISQADIVESRKAITRIANLGDLPEDHPGSLEVAQDLYFSRDGGSRWDQDEEEKTFALSTQKAGTEYPLWVFRYDPVDNVAGTTVYDLNSGSAYLYYGSFGATQAPYVHIAGAPFRIYEDFGVGSALFEYDPITRAFNVNGHPVGTSSDRWQSGAHKDPGATTLSVVGMTAWTIIANTLGNSDDVNGAWLGLNTSATIGNVAGVNGPTAYRPDWGIDCTFRVYMSATSPQRFWFGLFASDPSGSATPAVDGLGFRFDTGAGDTGFSVRTRSATGADLSTNVATANPGTPYLLRIQATSTEVNYYVDGTLVQTHSTAANIPATTLLAPWCRVTALTAAVRSFRFGFFTALSK